MIFMVFFADDVSAQSKKNALYDLGITVGAATLPDYPGADHRRTRYLALPYGVYRGKVLRTDEGLLKGKFLASERFEFDLSISAAFPADSSQNKIREGMPDLYWLGEIGPRMIYHILRNPSSSQKLDLSIPLRAVFATNFKRTEDRGFLFPPTLEYQIRDFPIDGTTFFVRTGVLLASERLAEYFYEVSPAFANANRPAYKAKAGYFSSRLGFGLRVSMGSQLLGITGIGFDNYHGSVNRESPLLRSKTTTIWFAALAWAFYQSKTMEESQF